MNKIGSTNNEIKIMNLFKSQGFNDSPLAPSNLVIYKKLMNEVFLSMQNSKKAKAIESLSQSYNLLFKELKQQNKSVNVSYIAKKSALIHGFIHKMATRQIQLTTLSNDFQLTLQEIKQEIKLSNVKQTKRSNTISQIYSYIRDISTSKQKINKKNKGKLKFQKQDDKGALKEIMNKIILPFINYLEKLISNFKDYSKILNGKAGEKTKQYMWKIANWSHIFDSILKELMRVGHYFRQDISGMYVLLSYIITLDLSVYYDFNESEIEKQSLSLNQQKLATNTEKRGQRELNDKLQEIKLLIKESNVMKQILTNIFCNEQLVMWRKYFSKSEYFNYELSHTNQPSAKDNLLELIGRLNHRKQKQRKRNQKLQSSSQLESENKYKQLNLNKQQKSEIFTDEEIREGETVHSGIGKIRPLKKMRLMHLNRGQRDGGMKRKSRLEM